MTQITDEMVYKAQRAYREALADPLDVSGDDWCAMRRALSAALPAPAQAPVWRHKVRGTTYAEVRRAEVQMATRPLKEGDIVVVYEGADMKPYARLDEEFEDGRFERLPDATAVPALVGPDGEQTAYLARMQGAAVGPNDPRLTDTVGGQRRAPAPAPSGEVDGWQPIETVTKIKRELFALCEATEDDPILCAIAARDTEGKMGAFARGRIHEAKGIRRTMAEVIRAMEELATIPAPLPRVAEVGATTDGVAT